MKRLPLALPAALAALALPAAAHATPSTLHLTEKQTFGHLIDHGKKGESPGDIRTFGGMVFESGKPVGHDQIRCVIAGACNAQVWVKGGSLIARRFIVTGPNFTAPITGGTGTYTGARGTVKVSTGAITRYTVTLTN